MQRQQMVLGFVGYALVGTGAVPARTSARWPDASRGETMEDALCLDRLLGQVWGGHPAYYRLDNQGRDWTAKAEAARAILRDLLV